VQTSPAELLTLRQCVKSTGCSHSREQQKAGRLCSPFNESMSRAVALHVSLRALATSLSRNYTNALLCRIQIAAMPEAKHGEVSARWHCSKINAVFCTSPTAICKLKTM